MYGDRHTRYTMAVVHVVLRLWYARAAAVVHSP